MYDLNKKIIFTHPPKCAGTTIEDLFDWIPKESDTQGIANYKKIRHSSLEEHIETVTTLGENASMFYKISCIRNPWEAAVSFYYHDKHYEVLRFKQNNPSTNLPELLKIAESSSFQDYITYQYRRFKNDYNFLETDKFFLLNEKYSLDYIVRYESLEIDLLNIKEKFSINKNISHSNKGVQRQGYKEHYVSSETINKVKEMANTTIELFGYSF